MDEDIAVSAMLQQPILMSRKVSGVPSDGKISLQYISAIVADPEESATINKPLYILIKKYHYEQNSQQHDIRLHRVGFNAEPSQETI